MKKSFFTLMATVAIVSSNPLLAMIEENLRIENKSSIVYQLPITFNQEVANEINKNKFVKTSAGKFELSPFDDRMVNGLCKNKNAFFTVPSSLFNEDKNLLLQRIYSQEDEFTIKSIILNKSEELQPNNMNAPVLNLENLKIEENKKSIAIIENIKNPIPVPQSLTSELLKQIIEDGYLNTTEGMFKFEKFDKIGAESMLSFLPSYESAWGYNNGEELTFSWTDGGMPNPSYVGPLMKNPNWPQEEPEWINNPLHTPNEPEWLPGMTYSFTLKKEKK